MQQRSLARVANPVGSVPGSSDASCGDTDPERTGHGERDGGRQGSGDHASGDCDLFHFHRLGGRFLFGFVAQDVS